MSKITVNNIEYDYEIEGVFDTMYALMIQLGEHAVHLEIYRSRPDEKYIRWIIERIQKT